MQLHIMYHTMPLIHDMHHLVMMMNLMLELLLVKRKGEAVFVVMDMDMMDSVEVVVVDWP